MTYESYSKVRTIGVFLLSAGIGALAAEYVPRLFRRQDTIWMPLGHDWIFFVLAGYLGCYGCRHPCVDMCRCPFMALSLCSMKWYE